jgi:hypothetical protein
VAYELDDLYFKVKKVTLYFKKSKNNYFAAQFPSNATAFYMTLPTYFRFLLLLMGITSLCFAQQQEKKDMGSINGSFQSDVQWYFEDSIINAQTVDEELMSNTFLQLTYQRGNFSAGIRYEAYLNPLLGFRGEYEGQGIPYRFAKYSSEKLDITVGNFYDQYGNGMIFRAYQEWTLGIDNSIDGVRVAFKPFKGLYLKGLVGTQRKFWNRSDGLMRGGDVEWFLHESFPKLLEKKWLISVGGSVLNRFLEDDNVSLVLPENVSAFAARASVSKGRFNINGEYSYKINDPFDKNNFTYNPGNGIYLNANYNQKGLGISASFKRIDNMDFRSERDPLIEELTLSFLPPTTLQHTWRLPTLYPYATQPNGEFGFQADLIYTIPRGTLLGGKYGTQISMNYSQVNALRKTFTDSIFTYEVDFAPQARMYFQDFNVRIDRKWNKKMKSTFQYINLLYDKGVIELGDENSPLEPVRTNVFVLETTYKVKRKHNLRNEIQFMLTEQDLGSWAMLLMEYSISPHWYFTVFDEWNFGNPDPGRRAHYYNVNAAYVFGANRISLAYGRQRAGLLCVGGICRVVPAANGFTLSVSSTF